MNFVLTVIYGRTEVNDFNLIVVFVVFEKYVFWLEITMHDFVAVAVIDALQQGFHENGSIVF